MFDNDLITSYNFKMRSRLLQQKTSCYGLNNKPVMVFYFKKQQM